MDFKASISLSPGHGGADLSEENLLHREELTEEHLKRIIRNLGLKITGQRLAILRALTLGRAHRTAHEIYESLKKNHPEIGFATVYRLLRTLAEKSYVTEVRMGGLPARYELTPKHHHDHLTCTECGAIVEFENQAIEKLQLQVARENGFKLTGHVLELYGICRSCQK